MCWFRPCLCHRPWNCTAPRKSRHPWACAHGITGPEGGDGLAEPLHVVAHHESPSHLDGAAKLVASVVSSCLTMRSADPGLLRGRRRPSPYPGDAPYRTSRPGRDCGGGAWMTVRRNRGSHAVESTRAGLDRGEGAGAV